MRNAIRAIAAVAVLMVAVEVYSQAPASAISLKLNVTPSSAKTGSNFVMEVDLTNNTKKQVVIEIGNGLDALSNFVVHVWDGRGNSVPEAKSDQWSLGLMGIQPGETRKFSSDLSKWFDLSRPDRYEIYVEKWDSDTNKNVRSNVVHIVVTAQ